MSTTTKSVRQPGGRKKYFDNSHFPCGVCSSCLPDSLGITIAGFDGYDPSYGSWYAGWCSSISATGIVPITDFTLPLDGELGSYCALSKNNTGSDAYCSYTGSFNTGVKTFRVDVQIYCLPGSPDQLAVSVILRGDNGDGTFTDVAYGLYTKDLPDGCGTADCSQGTLGDLSCSGDFTLYGGMSLPWCSKNANNPGTATFQIVGAGPCKSCDSLSPPCCCGGAQQNCYYACFEGGCSFDGYVVPLCWQPGDAKATGTITVSSGPTISARFDPKVAPPTLEWSCDNWSTSSSHAFGSGDHSTLGGNALWTATDVPRDDNCCSGGSATMTIKLSSGLVSCGSAKSCSACLNGASAVEYLVELSSKFAAQGPCGNDPLGNPQCIICNNGTYSIYDAFVPGYVSAWRPGLDGAYYLTAYSSFCDFLIGRGGTTTYPGFPVYGCCKPVTSGDFADGPYLSLSFLSDGGGYHVEIKLTGYGGGPIYGKWVKTSDTPFDCLSFNGEEIPWDSQDASAVCDSSGVSCLLSTL